MTNYQILHFALTALVILGGIQDWREREVSNWISVPLFLVGIVAAALQVLSLEFVPLVAAGLLIFAWRHGWMGGADAKILIGLWGLWPAAAFWGMFGIGLWGLVLILRRKGQERFPALIMVAFATVIQLLAELFKLCRFT
jgi:Flp pilus assembly protein protease CpaA